MRLLLVEDEKNLSDALVNILKKEKYDIDAAYNGEDGLNMGLNNEYDLIILDVMMPIMDGYQVLEALRKAKIKTPIMMLTALSQTSNKIKGLDLGADDYLAKPFHVNELLARLRALLRRKDNSFNETVLKYGNITLDLDNYSIIGTSNSVKVSVKEFEILRYLFEHPQIIAERNTLINKIWGYDNEIESNNLEVFMTFIRRKLKMLEADFTVESIRGVGYKLKAL